VLVAVRRIVVGTFNAGKVREIADLLAGLDMEVVSLQAFPGVQPVPETGATFEENARAKAEGLARQLGEAVLADDSGLEVDALGGRPGVLSARYGGEGLSDAERVERLLAELGGVPEAARTARFRCVVALADASGILAVAHGAVEGRIAERPSGCNGFGYDPVFIPEGRDRTFAEMEPSVKQSISHRSRALAALREQLRALSGRAASRRRCRGASTDVQ